MTDALKRRFSDLLAQSHELELSRRTSQGFQGGTDTSIEPSELLGWCVKVRNLLSVACGTQSEHYRAFSEAEEYSGWSGNYDRFKRARAVLIAAQEDFEGGYVVTIRNLVRAEVFDSELDQARQLLSAGYFQAAAIVAGVVLETSLRQICDQEQIAPGKLDRMNANLTKVGKYNSITQKRITSLAAIRNAAAHGNTHEFSTADVGATIDDVERLVEAWLT